MFDLRERLLALIAEDQRVRAELAADGSLFEGYHPRMEQVHRANAQALRDLIRTHGWPTELLASPDGAAAAWLVAQHSIGEPAFMRECRDRLEAASVAGLVPKWQFAYIDDRIRIFEGKPQRYGTQLDLTPDGPQPCALEDASKVDALRAQAGLPPLEEVLRNAAAAEPRPDPAEYARKQIAELQWRRDAGWIA